MATEDSVSDTDEDFSDELGALEYTLTSNMVKIKELRL